MANSFVLNGPPIHGTISLDSTGLNIWESLKRNINNPQPAIINVTTGEKLSFLELLERSCKLAIKLKSLGYSENIIGICSENKCDYFTVLLAALYLGSPLVTFSPTYTKGELNHALGLTKPKIIFCSKIAIDLIKEVCKGQNLKNKIQPLEDLDGLTKTIKNFETFKPAKINNVKDHVAQLLFSSGTTGLPKAVMLTHYNLNALHNLYRDPRNALSEMSNFLVFLPFYHSYGLNISLGCLVNGFTIKFMPRFEERIFYQAIQDYKINFLTLVPPLMVLLAKSPLVDQYDLSSVKNVILAGASCSKELQNAVFERFNRNIDIHEGYGMTETTLGVISAVNGLKPVNGSVGTTHPGCSTKIRDPATGQSLGPHKLGEICVKSPCVMKGYYGNTEASQASFTDDNWLLTGDIGYYDEDGNIYIVDRLKELIKYKGYQVPPAELEAILLTHPKINDAAVVGLPDELAGELPLAFVVKKPNVELDEAQVVDFVKGQVSNAKQLRGGVRFVPSIPKNPSGKILRRELRELLQKTSKL